MIQFLLFAAITLATLALLIVPLARSPRRRIARGAYDLEVYREQLAELEIDAGRGLITAAQRDQARREIERRVLAVDLGPEQWSDRGAAPAARLAAAGAIVVLLPLVAGAVYLGMGSPTLPDRPLAGRAAEVADSTAGQGDIDQMVDRLAEKLAAEPGNLDGWLLLARSLGTLGRYDEAVAALRTVVGLTDRSPDSVAMLAEHVVFAADGVVTPEAKALFAEVAETQPDNPAVAFYGGLAAKQAGDPEEALRIWTAFGERTAAEAPWLVSLRAEIAAVATDLGLDPATYLDRVPEPTTPLPAAAAPGPSAEDMAAAAEMTPEDQAEMIRGMVARLAERLEREPGDLQGWLRLGNAYRVLGETDQARDALAKAAGLAPDDADVLEAYAAAITEAAPPGAAPPDAATLVWRRVLELDGANPAALWALGQSARARGETDEARNLFGRLRDLLPEGSAERARVEQELDGIGGG